ncbi:MAG: YggT family protein [Candidatus Omnitrophota bacterium]|nr:MAG: YggT family protein [Candidatus Omnitrophota bacterium]
MFVTSNFLVFLAKLLSFISYPCLWLIQIIIIIRALISWVNPDPYNPIVQFLNKVTEPILYPIRRMLHLDFRIGIDISPIIAILLIYILQLFINNFLVNTLIDLAYKLK